MQRTSYVAAKRSTTFWGDQSSSLLVVAFGRTAKAAKQELEDGGNTHDFDAAQFRRITGVKPPRRMSSGVVVARLVTTPVKGGA